jgi:hypothetical protein
MAHAVRGNMLYIDSTGTQDLLIPGIRVVGILLSENGAASSTLILNDWDGSTATPLVNITTTQDFTHIDLTDSPLVFPNGLRVSGLTANNEATVIYQKRS